MFDKILLPVDINHPESWEKTLPAARQCAGDTGEIHLLGIVHDLGSAVISSFLPEGFEKSAMETLKVKLADLVSKEMPESSKAEVHVGHGHVPETILRVAQQISADLIVMASHPPNDFQTLLVGSNANRVVRNSEIPVLTIR